MGGSMLRLYRTRWIALCLVVGTALASALGSQADGPTPNANKADGFSMDGFIISDAASNASAPSVAIGSLSGDPYDRQPWVAYEQRVLGPDQAILVKAFNLDTGEWERRGTATNDGSLNF